MSQHNFKTTHAGRPVLVLMGWDRPLSQFFMVVEYLDADDQYAYSNLDDPDLSGRPGDGPELDYFRGKLALLGIAVPALMLGNVQLDRAVNRGNYTVHYDQSGRVTERVSGH